MSNVDQIDGKCSDFSFADPEWCSSISLKLDIQRSRSRQAVLGSRGGSFRCRGSQTSLIRVTYIVDAATEHVMQYDLYIASNAEAISDH